MGDEYKAESEAERQYRIGSEKLCRQVADDLKAKLPESLGFLLMLADYGGGFDSTFSNTSYVSTIRREDAARLIAEFADRFQEQGLNAEPTARTATFLRESAFALRDVPVLDLIKGLLKDAARLRNEPAKRQAIAGAIAVQALAIFGRGK
jgi:hypothetical protein